MMQHDQQLLRGRDWFRCSHGTTSRCASSRHWPRIGHHGRGCCTAISSRPEQLEPSFKHKTHMLSLEPTRIETEKWRGNKETNHSPIHSTIWLTNLAWPFQSHPLHKGNQAEEPGHAMVQRDQSRDATPDAHSHNGWRRAGRWIVIGLHGG